MSQCNTKTKTRFCLFCLSIEQSDTRQIGTHPVTHLIQVKEILWLAGLCMEHLICNLESQKATE